jgi:hypothetical protein
VDNPTAATGDAELCGPAGPYPVRYSFMCNSLKCVEFSAPSLLEGESEYNGAVFHKSPTHGHHGGAGDTDTNPPRHSVSRQDMAVETIEEVEDVSDSESAVSVTRPDSCNPDVDPNMQWVARRSSINLELNSVRPSTASSTACSPPVPSLT